MNLGKGKGKTPMLLSKTIDEVDLFGNKGTQRKKGFVAVVTCLVKKLTGAT